MRDYLYVWHEPQARRVVASGVEFRDVVPGLLNTGGIVLLRHQFDEASFEPRNRLEFVPAENLTRLAADDVYGYGDFCWADFGRGVSLADLEDSAVAALTFFAHAARPLGDVPVPGLSNRLLCHAHDDGWYTRFFYTRWDAIGSLLEELLARLLDEPQVMATRDVLQRGEAAFWCRKGSVVECERMEDIDTLLHKHL